MSAATLWLWLSGGIAVVFGAFLLWMAVRHPSGPVPPPPRRRS